MKTIFLTVLSGVVPLAFILTAGAAERKSGSGFAHPVGLQLYSLRDQFAKDVPGTLDKVRDFGFKNVELAGTYEMPPEKFKAELDARGLRAVAGDVLVNVPRLFQNIPQGDDVELDGALAHVIRQPLFHKAGDA